MSFPEDFKNARSPTWSRPQGGPKRSFSAAPRSRGLLYGDDFKNARVGGLTYGDDFKNSRTSPTGGLRSKRSFSAAPRSRGLLYGDDFKNARSPTWSRPQGGPKRSFSAAPRSRGLLYGDDFKNARTGGLTYGDDFKNSRTSPTGGLRTKRAFSVFNNARAGGLTYGDDFKNSRQGDISEAGRGYWHGNDQAYDAETKVWWSFPNSF